VTPCPVTFDPAADAWVCPDCGWTSPPGKFPADAPPRNACPASETSETQARRRARLTGRLLAEIDAAIEAGDMAPWSYFPRDREAVAAILTAHCQPCPELSRAGCNRVPWPCKRWSLWKQTVLVGWCKRWGQRAVDGSR
jgi:hypothetical protein